MAERTVVSKVSNAVLYSDGTIRIDGVRLSYPHLDKPYESEGDDGNKKSQYSADSMLPKETHKAAKDLVKKVIEQLMDENKVKVPTANWFLKDGDKLAEEDENKSTLAGHFLVKAAEKRRPTVRKRNGETMTEREIEDTIYGGVYANVLIRPWYFNGKARSGKTYPKRILANLIAVQFVRDGEPFGEGRISDDGVFDAVEGDDGFDDDSGDDL
jgi:hypothetical protein